MNEKRLFDNVVFIGEISEGKFKPRGTGFYVSITQQHHYLVTAAHVIHNINTDIKIRINTESNTSTLVDIPKDIWRIHPDQSETGTDIAIAPFDFRQYKKNFVSIDVTSLLTPEKLSLHNIDVGSDVFMVGLFASHHGKDKNIPIVRKGSISAFPDDPIPTKLFGYIDAILIEARSIGGLSGCPVFYQPPQFFIHQNQLKHSNGTQFGLLGLIHGHFDVKNLNEDVVTDDVLGGKIGIHSGIGVVVPAIKILETLNHPDFLKLRN